MADTGTAGQWISKNTNTVLLVSAAWQMLQDDGLLEIPKFLWMRVVGQWLARLGRLMSHDACSTWVDARVTRVGTHLVVEECKETQ